MCAFRARARYRPAWWTTILTEGMWGHSVPKYKFQWNNLPAASLRVLCRELGFPDEDPADLLRAAYGARPTDAFVQEVWPLVREGWLARGWKNSQKQPVANRDLWEPLIELVRSRNDVTFRWVKGHSGNAMNDLVDRLAVTASNGPFLPVDSTVHADDPEASARQGIFDL